MTNQQQIKKLQTEAKRLKKAAAELQRAVDAESNKGLRCPRCGCGHFYTDKTVDVPGRRRRRYKTCRACGKRVRTTEMIEPD